MPLGPAGETGQWWRSSPVSPGPSAAPFLPHLSEASLILSCSMPQIYLDSVSVRCFQSPVTGRKVNAVPLPNQKVNQKCWGNQVNHIIGKNSRQHSKDEKIHIDGKYLGYRKSHKVYDSPKAHILLVASALL